jgi:hypothetical protein
MMHIIEIYGGFKIQFDAKLSMTITTEEARYILDYLKGKQKNGTFDNKDPELLAPKKFAYYDCGEY